MTSTRNAAVSLLAGVVHAVLLVVVALRLGYSVGPTEYSLVGLTWRYGGLVAVAAVPVWVALRFRVVSPLVALLVTSGYVLGMELSPPGPTFRDVAELEHLAEPTGITVVEHGLYAVRYMVNASVWLAGFCLLGLIEYVARRSWGWLPDVTPASWLPIPATRRRAAAVAAAAGGCHAAVMVPFAVRLGVTISSVPDWPLYLFGTLGMWVLGAAPTYLLVRHRLLGQALCFAWLLFVDVRAEFQASVEDAHALYFGGWFVFLGAVLVVAGVEYGLRRLDVAGRVAGA